MRARPAFPGIRLIGQDSLFAGAVSTSIDVRLANASAEVEPHMEAEGRKLTHTAGRSGLPNKAQRMSGRSWMHRTPAGLPCGMPGIGEVIEGAMQQAPQFDLHSMNS